MSANRSDAAPVLAAKPGRAVEAKQNSAASKCGNEQTSTYAEHGGGAKTHGEGAYVAEFISSSVGRVFE